MTSLSYIYPDYFLLQFLNAMSNMAFLPFSYPCHYIIHVPPAIFFSACIPKNLQWEKGEHTFTTIHNKIIWKKNVMKTCSF